jgi:peptide chain release factor 1
MACSAIERLSTVVASRWANDVAGAAEQADLTALGIGRQQVDAFDAGDQDLLLGRLILEPRRLTMDRPGDLGIDRAALVDRLADHVQDAAERLRPDRDLDRVAGIDRLGAAHQAVGRVHRDGADRALAQMLGHIQHQSAPGQRDMQRIQDPRQLILLKLNVHDGADDLSDLADSVAGHLVRAPVRAGRGVRPPQRRK